MSGLPTSEFFSNLSRALRLSPVEQDELAQQLEIARVGEAVSYSRRQIFDLIEMISELTEYMIPFSKEVDRKTGDRENQPATEPIETFSNPMAVLNLIENSIDQELFSAAQPDLKLCIPNTESKVYDYIFQQMMGNKKKLNLADVLGFRQRAAADEPDQALAALRHLIALSLLEKVRHLKHVVKPLPCFSYYIDRELLELKLNKDFPYYQPLLEAATSHYDDFRKESHAMLNVFSLKNLEQFMRDGSLSFPDEVYHVLTPAERLRLVQLVRDDLANDRRNLFAIDDELFFMNGSTEFTNEQDLIRFILHYRKNNQLVFKAIEIHEPSVVAAFDDFFTSMIKSKYILPKEQTLVELDRLMQLCEV